MGDQLELHPPIMIMAKSRQQKVDANFDAFQKLLPDLLLTRAGKFAVMHNGAVIEFFDSLGAVRTSQVWRDRFFGPAGCEPERRSRILHLCPASTIRLIRSAWSP